MPTDPRDTGFTVPTTDSDGYSDLVQINGVHTSTWDFPAVESTVTEIWFEHSRTNDSSECKEAYYDDGDGTSSRLKITVPTDMAGTGWTTKIDPGKFSGLYFLRLQLTDGSAGVQQTAERSVVVGGRDYR